MGKFLINEEDGSTIFYHGSKNGITGKIEPCSHEKCDFGRGFYIGTKLKQAEDIACHGKRPTIYQLQIPQNLFNEDNTLLLSKEDWLFYTLYNRGYLNKVKDTELYRYYSTLDDGKQFVIGAIMDDSFQYCLDDFLHRRMSDKAFFEIIDSFNYGIQIVPKTQEACNMLVVLKEKTHVLSQSEIEQVKRRHQKVVEDGFNIFCDLRELFGDLKGMTYGEICKKAINGYMPKKQYNKKELMGYDVIQFPNIIHTKGDSEYEPFR